MCPNALQLLVLCLVLSTVMSHPAGKEKSDDPDEINGGDDQGPDMNEDKEVEEESGEETPDKEEPGKEESDKEESDQEEPGKEESDKKDSGEGTQPKTEPDEEEPEEGILIEFNPSDEKEEDKRKEEADEKEEDSDSKPEDSDARRVEEEDEYHDEYPACPERDCFKVRISNGKDKKDEKVYGERDVCNEMCNKEGPACRKCKSNTWKCVQIGGSYEKKCDKEGNTECQECYNKVRPCLNDYFQQKFTLDESKESKEFDFDKDKDAEPEEKCFNVTERDREKDPRGRKNEYVIYKMCESNCFDLDDEDDVKECQECREESDQCSRDGKEHDEGMCEASKNYQCTDCFEKSRDCRKKYFKGKPESGKEHERMEEKRAKRRKETENNPGDSSKGLFPGK